MYYLILSAFLIFTCENIAMQGDEFEEYRSELQGKGQALVEEVRKKNGVGNTTDTFLGKVVDQMIGGCLEESPVDFLIARDFPTIDAAVLEARTGSNEEVRAETESGKPTVIVIYRKSYLGANPELLERMVRQMSVSKSFAFIASYEDFHQLACVYVVCGSKLRIFDVRNANGKFGVYEREEVFARNKDIETE